MKIAVNLLPFKNKIGGAGKYAQKIIKNLSLLDKENEYYLYITNQGSKNFKDLSSNFHFVNTHFYTNTVVERIYWEQLIFPTRLKSLKPDILFTPSVAIPYIYNGTFFTTIHDLAYKRLKTKYPPLRRLYVKLVSEIALNKSDVIFTVSDFSKKEIEAELGEKNKEIVVTYNGVDDCFFEEYSEKDKYKFLSKYNLSKDYLLYVGAIEPGKNLDKLFSAFAELMNKYGFNQDLVLTSGISWGNNKLENLVRKLNIKDRVILLPYINEDEMPLLYKCSSMLTYLSTYEGFGIPVLEAMATGTAVVTSQSNAILEFAADGVLSVDPNNIEDITSSMLKIIQDQNYKQMLTDKAKMIARKFRWINSAQIIVNKINSFKNNNY